MDRWRFVRPTAQPKSKQKRERRRPDPLIAITPQLEFWFKAEPWRTASEFLHRLQTEHPGEYPASLIRTLQRRLKIWRAEHVHHMVFGAEDDEPCDQATNIMVPYSDGSALVGVAGHSAPL